MGFTREELEAQRGATVPDLVGDDVRLLFVGINPGLWTAASGAHFGHPGNRFYKALYAAGVTDEILEVSGGFDEGSRRALTGRGIAITNLVDRATAKASELDDGELREGAQEVERKIDDWGPDVVAFVGITAYRTAFAERDADVGRQERTLAGAPVWALPNPSGLNAHYQVDDLARLYRAAAAEAGLELAPLRTGE